MQTRHQNRCANARVLAETKIHEVSGQNPGRNAPYLASPDICGLRGQWRWYGLELAAPTQSYRTASLPPALIAADLAFAPRGVLIGTSAPNVHRARRHEEMRRPAGIARLVRMNRPVDPAL